MADPYAAGLSFRNFLSNAANMVRPFAQEAAMPGHAAVQTGTNAIMAAAPSINDFIGGITGAARPSVTVALPDATPAVTKAKVAPVAAPKAPAAAAVAKGAAKADDGLGALGNLSFRQILALSQANENTQPRGVIKQPTNSDAAGAALAAIYQQQFKSSLDAASKDPAKQQAAVDAFEKKMLPLALKGNTADEYLYGNQ